MMGQAMDAPISPNPMAQSFRTEFPEVVNATRIQAVRQEIMIQHEDIKIYIEKGGLVDSVYFEVFKYEFIHGDPLTALDDVNSMVITEETAQKFFGEENPMGKILNYDTRQDYVVTGVVKEPKGKSHVRFDIFLSANEHRNVWMSNNFFTYVKLKKGMNVAAFTTKMNDAFMVKIEPEIQQFLKTTVAEFLAAGNTFKYDLQPIKDIHLRSNRDWEAEQNGNIMYIYVFIAVAILVLLIAGINFMNLSTARSAKRAKEVGIRKVFRCYQRNVNRAIFIRIYLTKCNGIICCFCIGRTINACF